MNGRLGMIARSVGNMSLCVCRATRGCIRTAEGQKRPRNTMKSDSDIKRDVEEELRFDPDIDATDIGVAVKRWRRDSRRLRQKLHGEIRSRSRSEARGGRSGTGKRSRSPPAHESPDPE